MAAGMLSNILTPPYRDLLAQQATDERQLQNLAGMDSFAQARYAGLQGSQMAGQGAAQAVAGAAGLDTRSPMEKNVAAIQAAKAQASQLGLDPNDPNSVDQFYKQVIAILQKNGLVGEASDVAREWHTQKLGDQKLQLENDKLEQQKVRDADLATYRAGQIDALNKKYGAAGSAMGKLLQDWAKATDPYAKANLEKAISNAGAGKVLVENAGDRLILRDATTREVIATDTVGAKPMDAKAEDKKQRADLKMASAYRDAKAGIQQQYDAAVDLYNMPGFDAIFGRLGRLVGEKGGNGDETMLGRIATTFSRDATRDALEKWRQVTGGTFLQGLSQLKAASPTGSTGLGQVSNIEGEKVQAAGAALGRSQSAAAGRQQLQGYIQTIVGASQRLDAAAQAEGIQPIPLREKPLKGVQGAPSATQPPVAPVAQPAAPSAPAAAPRATPGTGIWSIKRKQ